jgi:hypothetical protein
MTLPETSGTHKPEPRSHLRMRAALDGECPICFYNDLSAVGDRMQSAASRLAEWVLEQYEKPYEVMMAAIETRAEVEKWTEIRKRP